MIKFRSLLIVLALGVLAAGLSGCVSLRIKELAKYIRDEEEYEYALAKEYLVLAARESNLYFDKGKAHYYATKGLKVLTGAKVLPEETALRALRSKDRHALEHARSEIMHLLKTRAQTLSPIAMAQAVAKFDCWLEEQEEGWTQLTPHTCQADFHRALQSVHHETARQPYGRPVSIYYKLGKTDLNKRSRHILDELLGIIHNRPRTQIHIDGFADRTGHANVNHRVSHERATHVEDYLLRHGVSHQRIKARSHGSKMAKGHKGVPHLRDRRTDIKIVPDFTSRFQPPENLAHDLGQAGAHPRYDVDDDED